MPVVMVKETCCMPEFILSAILLYRTSLGNRGLIPIVVCTSQTLSAQLSLAIEVDCDDGLCMELSDDRALSDSLSGLVLRIQKTL